MCNKIKIPELLIAKNTLNNEQLDKLKIRYKIEDFIIPDKNINHNNFNERLISPIAFNYNVTTDCKFRCKYCYHPLNPVLDYISIDRLRYIFNELKDIRCESVFLTGGDPILREDIGGIMKTLSEISMPYTISTKSILTDKQIKFFSNECNLKTIQLSIDSLDIDCVKFHIGISDDNYVKKVISMIKTLCANNIRVRVKSVITKYNINNIINNLNTFFDLGIEKIHLSQYIRSGHRHSDDLFPTAEQLNNFKLEIIKFKETSSVAKNLLDYDTFEIKYATEENEIGKHNSNIFSKRFICSSGRSSITLLPNGEASICENLPYKKEFVLGDLRKQSVMEYKKWLEPPDRNIFPDGTPCKTCNNENYEICHKLYSRCLKQCYEVYNNVNMPDINCPYAKFKNFRKQ